MRLSLVPPWPDDEPLQSFASRIARCHGADLGTFCHEVGVSRRSLADGGVEATHRLAELTGRDPTSLAMRTFERVGHTWRYKEQVLHRVGMRRSTLYVCPRCLCEDIAGSALRPHRAVYVRAHWLVGAVRTCVRHGVALVTVAEPGVPSGLAIHDFSLRLAPMLRSIERVSDDVLSRPPTTLERYVVERLHGKPFHGGMADALPLHAAVRTCEMLGVTVLFGSRTRTSALSADEWRAAGAAGFDVASLGECATFDSLSAMLAESGGDRRYAGGTKAFGRLYGWLKSDDSGPDYEPFRALVRKVVVERLPIAPGTQVLGIALDRRRVHSLRSAAEVTGRGLKSVRRDLGVAGLLPTGGDRAPELPVAMRVEDLNGTLASSAESLSRTEAAKRLGATVADLVSLAEAGLLKPLARMTYRSQIRYSTSALDEFLDALERRVGGMITLGTRMHDIPTTARISNKRASIIVTALLDGRIHNIAKTPSAVGYRSILIDVDETLSLTLQISGKHTRYRIRNRARLREKIS